MKAIQQPWSVANQGHARVCSRSILGARPPEPGRLRSRPLSSLRGAGGGLSLVRALGASDVIASECGSETGAGIELAGDGAPVWGRIALQALFSKAVRPDA